MKAQGNMLDAFQSYCLTKWWGGLMDKTLV
jgi:hypothetical protein